MCVARIIQVFSRWILCQKILPLSHHHPHLFKNMSKSQQHFIHVSKHYLGKERTGFKNMTSSLKINVYWVPQCVKSLRQFLAHNSRSFSKGLLTEILPVDVKISKSKILLSFFLKVLFTQILRLKRQIYLHVLRRAIHSTVFHLPKKKKKDSDIWLSFSAHYTWFYPLIFIAIGS